MDTATLSDREKAAWMQGVTTGVDLSESNNLTNADRDTIDHCRTISYQILTGKVVDASNVRAFRRLFDEFFTPRSDVVIEAAHAAGDVP